MAIQPTDLNFRLSGGAANANPLLSLGGAKSSVALAAAVFDLVSGAEAQAGDVEYRCGYVHNASNQTLYAATVWVLSDTPGVDTAIAVGLGTSALNGTEQTVANEGAAPAGVAFLAAATKAGGVVLGDIPAGQSRAFWLRRTTTAGAAAVTGEAWTLAAEGEFE